MDKQKIKQSFSKSAVSYDQYADLQQEVLVFIEFLQFKSGLKKFPKNIDQIMKFAGCWEDMPDETFTEFSNEIDKRRKQAF